MRIFASLLISGMLSFSAPSAFAAMNCKAIFRTLDSQNRSIERTTEVPVDVKFSDFVKYSVEFEGKLFALTEDTSTGDLLGQIIAGPDYIKGSVFRGQATKDGRFNLSEVNGADVYRMECRKK